MFKRYADFVAKLRVPCGFALVLAFGWFSRPTPESLTEGLLISLAGLALRAWATGHLEKNRRLTRSGPYSFVRNPLYLGTLLVAAGFVVAGRQWLLAMLFTLVFLFIYLPVIELEEQHLRNLFPEFKDYEQRVPGLVPTLRPERHAERFRVELYRRNREYQALWGFLAGVAFLVGKMLFTR